MHLLKKFLPHSKEQALFITLEEKKEAEELYYFIMDKNNPEEEIDLAIMAIESLEEFLAEEFIDRATDYPHLKLESLETLEDILDLPF
jgi:hypothetical protein